MTAIPLTSLIAALMHSPRAVAGAAEREGIQNFLQATADAVLPGDFSFGAALEGVDAAATPVPPALPTPFSLSSALVSGEDGAAEDAVLLQGTLPEKTEQGDAVAIPTFLTLLPSLANSVESFSVNETAAPLTLPLPAADPNEAAGSLLKALPLPAPEPSTTQKAQPFVAFTMPASEVPVVPVANQSVTAPAPMETIAAAAIVPLAKSSSDTVPGKSDNFSSILKPSVTEEPLSKQKHTNTVTDRIAKAIEAVQGTPAATHAQASLKASENAAPIEKLFAPPVSTPVTSDNTQVVVPANLSLPANAATVTMTPAQVKFFNDTLTHNLSAVDQIVARIKTIARPGVTHVRMQLEPAELGHIEVKLHVSHDGKAGMIVTADQKQTLELLQRDVRGLEQLLADSGLKANSGSLSFHLRGEQGNPAPYVPEPRLKVAATEQEIIAASVAEQTIIARSGIDIRV